MSRGSSPDITCVQPDHFYPTGVQNVRKEDPGTLYDPDQDPFATRGIPVFRPTMDEFKDFEGYMEKVEVWGRKSGIVKIIPPAEWTKSLPSTLPLLPAVKLKSPIEQRMEGGSGLFRQQNIEKRKILSVMDWVNMCDRPSLKSPSPNKTVRGARVNSSETRALHHSSDVGEGNPQIASPSAPSRSPLHLGSLTLEEYAFYGSFDPHSSWLPPNTNPSDYTPEACRNLERNFWRTCGIATPAWYGADMQGSLFTDTTTTFNVAHLPSLLTRLKLTKPLPGVNTPYLYFGMWRATFAWHVEDMDLYSINYIHWGAPKFWYAVPTERSNAFEGVMRGYFPADTSSCPEFLRHKSYLASPTLLAESACRPNVLVQHQGEFVITFPRGYHAGFNLGLNCAESVNFALENWVELGRKAGFCQCVPDSVRIDVDALIAESAQIQEQERLGLKRKPLESDPPVGPKRKRMNPLPTVLCPPSSVASPVTAKDSALTIKIAKREDPRMGCCLCTSSASRDSTLLRCVNGPPLYTGMKPVPKKTDQNGASNCAISQDRWMAHEHCAMVIPETWVDVVEGEKMVFGVDCIVKDRWNLKCSVCVKIAHKKHGAKIQCTRGKCSKAFHVSCAIEQEEVDYKVVEEAESEVVVIDGTQDLPLSHGSSPGDLSVINSSGDAPSIPESSTRMVKIVRKYLVSVLCSQHNPVIQEQRRLQRLAKAKSDLLALPLMSRIRVRVSSGVFEVTLLAVDEESNSVTVLWGDGVRRELKWGSIVWNTSPASHPSEVSEESKNVSSNVPLDSALGSSGAPSAPTQISVRKPRLPKQPRPPIPKPSIPKWPAESNKPPYPHVPRPYVNPLHTTYHSLPYHSVPYSYPHHSQQYAPIPYPSSYQPPISHGVTWPRDSWIPPELQSRSAQHSNIVSTEPSVALDNSNSNSLNAVQAPSIFSVAPSGHSDTVLRAEERDSTRRAIAIAKGEHDNGSPSEPLIP